MDKHEPCEHEIKGSANVGGAIAHAEDKDEQGCASAETQINQTQIDDGDQGASKKESQNLEEESNLKTVSDHPLKPSEHAIKESDAQAQSPTPRVMLHRSKSNYGNNTKSLTLPKVNCKEKIVSAKSLGNYVILASTNISFLCQMNYEGHLMWTSFH